MPRTGLSKLPEGNSIKCNIDGVLLLNKPRGITSNQALQIVKRLYFAKKSGHTGTLDPMATGLLPICFGEATKFSSMLLVADKIYQATMKLGYMSSTGDADGVIRSAQIDESYSINLLPDQLERRLQDFVGKIQQLPPMYSALKFQGKPLYKYAREGVEVERPSREIIIHDLQVRSLVENELQIMVKCGTGTYVRTLAEDIGKALGCGGAYLNQLSRVGIGKFDLSQALTLDEIENMSMEEREASLLKTDCLLEGLQSVNLEDQLVKSITQGRLIDDHPVAHKLSVGEKIRLYDCENRFIGLGEIVEHGGIAPKRLVVIK